MKIGFPALIILSLFLSAHTVPPLQHDGSIINLFDAFSKNGKLKQAWGFSALVEYKGKMILFDAGSNADVFKHNTEALGIDVRDIDIVVVSHSHYDHLNGIDYLLTLNPKVKIYFPFDAFWGANIVFDATGQDSLSRQTLPRHMQYFNGAATKFNVPQSGGRFWQANIEYVKSKMEIAPGLTLIPTSAGYMGYFSKYPNKSFVEGSFTDNQTAEDKHTNLQELSLSIKTGNGQVLMVGCSHTGVENIVREALHQTNDKIDLLYGGFHLIPYDGTAIKNLATQLKDDLKVRRVAPAHCTGHLAFQIFQRIYRDDYLYAGLGERTFF